MAELSAGEGGALEATEYYQLLLESIRDYAVIVTDQEGMVKEWNVGAERLFGFLAADIMGQTADVIFTAEDRRGERAEHERAAAVEKGSTADERWHVRADKTRRYVSGRMQVIRREGKLLGFIKVGRDETERQLATAQVEEAQREAEEANAAKDRFLAVLSHELRNPLSPVLASAAILLRDLRLPEDLREEVQTIRRNTQLEARLLDDLLDATRIGRGVVHLAMEPVLIESLIMQILVICRPEIKGKKLRVDVVYGAGRSCVRGDPARLQQILWNLLKNAIKFSPEGEAIVIETGNVKEGEVRVSVRDHGIGLEGDQLQRIFRPFEQADASISQRFGGLGLGLSISRTLAELHGGTVVAESDGAGRGATFVLTLPTIEEDDCVLKGELVAKKGGAARKLRILLVEDNADAARALSKLLGMSGHVVSVAGSAGRAAELVEREVFDVLLSDIGLGEGSGLDVVREVRARQPGMHTIAISGFGTQEDIERSEAAGFDRHLVKPVDPEVLEEVLEGVGEEIGEG